MCFNSENLPPLYFDGVLLPCINSFKYLGMVCNKQINLNTAVLAQHFVHFTSGTFKVKEFIQERYLANWLHAYGLSRLLRLLLVCYESDSKI